MKSFFCFIIIILLWSPAVFSAQTLIRLSTAKGVYQGELVSNSRLFPYIAYAEAPVGKYRWRKVPLMAQAKQRVSPVRCPQTGTDFFHGGEFPMQEDCLYLNVWAPKLGEKHPVILLIHGGGLIAGNGLQRFYDGSIFADKNVVFVAFNYRLEELGYGPNLEKVPGSLGLWDQANAIQWVVQNIEQFGGDPNNIYLMGHSKGAEAVSALMETGLADEHVKGGIAMSNARHFDEQNNTSFPKIQTQFRPGEITAPWEKVLQMKTAQDFGVYVPTIPRVRTPDEGKHRFQLITTVLYDERFWGEPHGMYCTQAFFLKQFFPYIDAYFFLLHPGAYDHGKEVYSLFSQDKFGKVFRDYIVAFVNKGRPPNLNLGFVEPKPFRDSLTAYHLYPWFSLQSKFHDVWKGVECELPKKVPGSQIGFFWQKLELFLNALGYGRADRAYEENISLKKEIIPTQY